MCEPDLHDQKKFTKKMRVLAISRSFFHDFRILSDIYYLLTFSNSCCQLLTYKNTDIDDLSDWPQA
jgi:hypothetical protein